MSCSYEGSSAAVGLKIVFVRGEQGKTLKKGGGLCELRYVLKLYDLFIFIVLIGLLKQI